MLAVINVALRRRIGGVAGLANSEQNRLRAFILNSEKATAFEEKEEQAEKARF